VNASGSGSEESVIGGVEGNASVSVSGPEGMMIGSESESAIGTANENENGNGNGNENGGLQVLMRASQAANANVMRTTKKQSRVPRRKGVDRSPCKIWKGKQKHA